MTSQEIKVLKDNLWTAADLLRAGAHLAPNKYGQPILGLIFLRYAEIRYGQHKDAIIEEYNRLKGGRREKSLKEIAKEKCGFYLPEDAVYSTINAKPDDANKATLIKNAMNLIEEHNDTLMGVLPKDVYFQLVPEEEPDLLSKIVKIFMDIPETIEIDLFGEIYEFFLGKFALAEGQGGGMFYTPASVVQYMVEVLKPEGKDKKFLDPACGSGGMFVQAARYMHKHNANGADLGFRVYGVEKESDTVKLAKMNILLNNIRGEITEANSFYSDPYDSYGNFDFVMANPPFNVDEVLLEKVKEKNRFKEYGVPQNKSRSSKKKDDAKETVPNANYLWISQFATALNNTGRAGFVMANSASDAGGSELEIRTKMIKAGIIKQMVTLPSNMFNTVTLPATLWFFDKAKTKKDEILFIDARNIFTQVDRAHRKFSEEQIKNLGIITRLYEGDTQAFNELINQYKANLEILENKEYWQQQIDWLLERFPEGKYRDVIGLCKVAKIGEILDKQNNVTGYEEDSIGDNDFSLNAGRYVGVVIEDDGMTEEEFKNTILSLNDELTKLNSEAKDLEDSIAKNLLELFGE